MSFCADAGEFVSVIGPSGCGKSTIFNVLAGLESPTSGSVRVGTRATESGSHLKYTPRTCPQKDLLFPWRSVLDNTALGLEVRSLEEGRTRALGELFPAFSLTGFEDARPSQLSGSMRQRAAMLRTVVQGKPVRVARRAVRRAGLLTRTEMQAWLQDVWQYRWTVLSITHDIREAIYLSDRVVVLSCASGNGQMRRRRFPLPRPRELDMITTPKFAEVERELLAVLHDETRKSGRP